MTQKKNGKNLGYRLMVLFYPPHAVSLLRRFPKRGYAKLLGNSRAKIHRIFLVAGTVPVFGGSCVGTQTIKRTVTNWRRAQRKLAGHTKLERSKHCTTHTSARRSSYNLIHTANESLG